MTLYLECPDCASRSLTWGDTELELYCRDCGVTYSLVEKFPPSNDVLLLEKENVRADHEDR